MNPYDAEAFTFKKRGRGRPRKVVDPRMSPSCRNCARPLAECDMWRTLDARPLGYKCMRHVFAPEGGVS